MNHLCYKTVFSKRLGTLVAVGEHASSQSKGQGARAGASWMPECVGARFVGVLALGFVAVSVGWSQTLPQGGRVSQGKVTVSQSDSQMDITQSSPRAVMNWQSFDIGQNAKVNVLQPSSQSVLLNRVLSDNPTQILGQLQANGQVVLVNPKGIVVGSDGSVSAAGFTASTLNISDADFMAGQARYTRDGSTGEVVNKGRIVVAPGGYVALLGARVSNEGQIVAPQGGVALGAAETVSVPIGRTGKIKLELTPASINASVANQKDGLIVTEGGQVYLQAAAVSQAVASVLNSGHIDTSGAQAGAVHLLADGGQIKVDGRITANSSGHDAPGQVRKGGDIVIGRDEETGALARATDVSGAQLQSQGGFVETSGDHLTTTGARVLAKEWLLDPYNITIAASGASGTGYGSNYTSAADSVILASDISANLSAGTSVTLATGAGGSSTGDINVNASISKSGGAEATLTLKAHNDIVVAASTTITSTTGKLNVVMNSDLDGNSAGAIVMNSGSGITSLGGNITLGGGVGGLAQGYASGYNQSTRYTGISLNSSTLSAGGGHVSIKGQGTTTFLNTNNLRGVDLIGTALTTSGSGNITIDGVGGNGNVSNTNVGVGLTSGSTITGSSGGAVSLTGTGGNGALYNFGVWLSGSTVKISSPGAITLTGTAGGSGTYGLNSGVMIQGSATLEATGSGTVTITGTGGNTTGDYNHGVEITNGSVKSQSGNIQITGSRIANTALGSGIYLGGTGTVTSSGNGFITLSTDSLGLESTTSVNAGTGTVTVQNRTAGTLIDVGGTSADVANGTLKLGLSAAELARISAGTVVAGRNGTTASGNVTVNATNMGAMGNTSANLTVLSGGNLTVSGAVTKTAGSDATLNLDAANGIDINADVGATVGKLNVSATARGLQTGNASKGLSVGKVVNANGGVVTLRGSNNNIDGTTGNSRGVTFLSGSGITAASYDVLGVAQNTSSGSYGTLISGTANFNSTGDSIINGTSLSQTTALTFGTTIENGANVYFNAGSSGGKLVVKGSNAAWQTGLRIGPGADGGTATRVTTDGDVTLGALEANSNLSFRSGNITANSGQLTLLGQNAGIALSSYEGTAITANNGTHITIEGKSTSSTGTGVLLGDYSALAITSNGGGSVTIKGTTAGGTAVSIKNNSSINASGAVNITGTSTGNAGTIVGVLTSATSTIQGTSVSIKGDALLGNGINLGSTVTAINAGTISLEGTTTSTATGIYGIKTSGTLTATGGNIYITADTLDVGNTISTGATGKVSIASSSAYANFGGLDSTGTTGTEGLGLSATEIDRITTAKLSVESKTGNVFVDTAVTTAVSTGDIHLKAFNAIELKNTLTVGGTSASKNLTLETNNATGTVTQTAALKAAGLELLGSQATFTLNNVANDVQTLAGNAKSITYFDATALSIGTVANTSGLNTSAPITVESNGNMTVTQAISTSNAGTTAVVLNAGKSTNAGTASGGDISFSGNGAVSVGNGGRATLFTGSVAGSTGLGIVSGNNRFNSDELSSGYTTALGSGIYAIYREVPTLSVRFNDANKTYNGQAFSSGTGVTVLSGLVGNDTSALLGAINYSGTSQGAINAGTYPISGTTSSTPTALGYSMAYTSGTLTVNKADLSAIGSKVYDADTAFAGISFSSITGVNGETFTATGTGTLASKNVQSAQQLQSLGNLALVGVGGALAGNYNWTTASTSVSVTARTLTVTGANKTVTYNGQAQTNSASIVGTQGSDTFSINGYGSGTNASSTAYADNLSITGTGGTLLSNYNISYTQGGLTINKANLTLSGTRVYDASTTFAGQYLTASGVNNETFTVTGTGNASNLSSKNVQTNQTLSSVTGLSLGISSNGGLISNYNDISTAGSSVNVTAKALATTANVFDKVYDGNRQATVDAILSTDIVGSDNVVIGNTSANFIGANVARDGSGLVIGQSVTVSGLSLSGTDALNYSLPSTSATTSAKITPKDVMLTSITAAHKEYDGNSQATITAGAITGTVGTETLAISGSGSFSDANAANNKAVTVADVTALTKTNGTGLWSNYALTTTGSMNTTANIERKAVSLTSITAANKVYDGTDAATITAGVITGTVNTQTLTISGSGSGSFSDKNAADGKTVSVADVATLNKTDGTGSWSNYTLTPGAITTTASIAPKAITLSGITGIDKVYDRDTVATVSTNGAVFNGQVAGDELTVQSTGVFTDKNVGDQKSVSLSHVLAGADRANYTITAQQTTTASITPKAATVSATATAVTYNGSVQNQAPETRSGFIAGDSITVLGQASGKNAGTYGSSLVVSGQDATNYNIAVNNANLVIDKATLTVTATQVTKTYDATLNASGSGTIGNLAGATAGDVVNSSGAQNFLDANAGMGKTVRASGVTIKDAANADMTGNYTIHYVDNTSSVINKARLTVTANDDARFVGLNDTANFAGVRYTGFAGGETSSVLGGPLVVERSNASTVEAGFYQNVLIPKGLTSNNYDIAYASGSYTIVPADQLLIRSTNQSITYGSAPTYDTTAQYLDKDKSIIITLNRTGSGNNFTFNDGANTTVQTVLQPYLGSALAGTSSTGHTVVGNYDIRDANVTVTGKNFVGSPVYVGTLAVNTKAVTPNATGVSKVYDGTTAMNHVVVGLTGEVTGDKLSIAGTGAFSQKNAGSNLSYTISNISLGGDDAGNYHLDGLSNSLSGSNGSITPAPLVLTSSHVSKTYDRSTSASGTALVSGGTRLFGSDTLSGGTFLFNDKQAGLGNKVVQLSNVTVGDGNNGGNYTVSYVDNTTSTILPKNLTAHYTAENKTYDGTNLATVASGSSDIISGDRVNLSQTGATFATKNVGANKTVTINGIALSGDDAGNYSLQNTTATTLADIYAKNLNVSYTANNKVYDGLTHASVTGTTSGILAGDDIGFTQIAHFSDKNVGDNKAVSITQIALSGAEASNYALAFSTANAAANIDRKAVALTSITAAHKEYDGNSQATITAGAITGTVGTETLAISGSGSFSDANAANNKAVTVADVTALTKTDGTGLWRNYALTTTGSMNTTANIERKAVSLASITASNKVYDGNQVANITAGSISGTLNGESLSISGLGTFNDKNAADNKTVTVQDVAYLTQTDGTGQWRNYRLSTTGSLSTLANITPKAVTLSGLTVANRAYDGSVTASVSTTGAVFHGQVAGDALTVTSTGRFADKHVGQNKTVTLANTLGGGDLGNYTITDQTSTTASITAKALTLTAASVSKTYDGGLNYTTSAADLNALSAQLVGGDAITAASLAFTDKNAGTGNKSVNLNSVTLSDGNGGANYQLQLAGNSSSTIHKAVITASLQGIVEKTYDGQTSATVNNSHFQTSGWVSGEGASIGQTAALYADPNVSINTGTGTVAANLQASHYTPLASTNLNNYTLASSASGAVGKINPAALNIRVNDSKIFVTQDANLAVDQGFTYTGLVNGESANTALVGGALTAGQRAYSGAQFPGVGSVPGVYSLSTPPVALNGNYTVTVTPGHLQVVPADQLLVTVRSQSDVYGHQTSANAGLAAANTVTAQYCLDQTNCNGTNLYTVNMTPQSGNTWRGTDNTGNTIELVTGLSGSPGYSSGAYLNAGNHTYGLSRLTSVQASQYKGFEVNAGVLTVTPLPVTMNASNVTKVYDGNTSLMTASLTPSGLLTGDALRAEFTSGNFVGKDAGSQSFSLSGLQLQGADKGNYVLGNAALSGTGTITPKAITVSGLQAQDKIYDGTTHATVQTTHAVFLGMVDGDQLSVLQASGQFDTRHVGSSKVVTLSSSFAGSDLGNYSITPQAGSSASITPAPLLVTAADARKTYDGNTSAPGTGVVGSLVGAAAGDRVDFAGSLAFADKRAGTGKTVTVTGVRLIDGNNTDVTGNYAIQYNNSQNGVIDKANASITAQASTTVYNGSTQTQNGAVLNGFLAGDDVQATGLASGRNAGSYMSSLSASGADAGNYNITFQNAALGISRRPASLAALNQSVVYNGQLQGLNGTQGSGFVAGDALAFGGLPSGRNVGQYTSAMTVTGADAANYDVTLGSATLTITPKTASVTAMPTRVTYNGSTQQQTAAVLEGFIAGDQIIVSGLATGRNAGVYGSSLLVGGADAPNYSILYQQGALTIDKAPLQWVGTAVADKVYDGNTDARVTAGRMVGLMGNESLRVDSVQGRFDNSEPGSAKPVQVVYGLSDGPNGGLVSNYDWSPVTVLASITREQSQRVPTPELVRPPSQYSRLFYQGFGGLTGVGTATGQLNYAIRPNDTQACSPANLQECVCEQAPDQGLEICHADPKNAQTAHRR